MKFFSRLFIVWSTVLGLVVSVFYLSIDPSDIMGLFIALLSGIFLGYGVRRSFSREGSVAGVAPECQKGGSPEFVRFAEFGELSSGLVHDIANPLTAASLHANKVATLLEAKASSDAIMPHAKQARMAVQRIERQVRALRRRLQKEEEPVFFWPGKEIREICLLLDQRAKDAAILLEIDVLDDMVFFGNADRFNQALENIVANALDAYRECDGFRFRGMQTVEITMKRSMWGGATISVRDKGVGIAKENTECIFEPFFTTRRSCGGTGLGLFHAKRIIEGDFRGSIKLRSVCGSGTVFHICFPRTMVSFEKEDEVCIKRVPSVGIEPTSQA